MQSVTLQGTVRTELGTKYAKQLRDQGHVPCVIYGGKAPIHFYAPMLAFRGLVYTAEARMASIELDGKTYNAVIQDMQFHVLTDSLTHVDFIEVLDGKPVTIVVPIVLTGNSRGVRSGGRLKSALRNLKVKGLIDVLPSSIEHDITELPIGQSIRVSDIKVGKIYEILNSDNAVVVSISSSRTSVADTNDDDEAAVEEAPAAEASAE
jgi:large subunit ribosomal protein L25